MIVIAHAADLVSTVLAGVPMLIAGTALAWQKRKERRARRRADHEEPEPTPDEIVDDKP